MRLFVFDDRVADAWQPYALTRPCGELLHGALLMRERLERFAGRPATASLTRDWLTGFAESDAPQVLPRAAGSPPGEALLLSSRFVPGDEARFEERGEHPILLVTRDGVAGCYLPDGHPPVEADWLEAPDEPPGVGEWPRREVEGQLVDAVWLLVAGNGDRLARDLAADATSFDTRSGLPSDCHRIGEGDVLLGADVRIEPGVVFDTRNGPVRLARAVDVRAGTRLEGPLYAGPRTHLLGGSFAGMSAGPECRLRGEIEATVILGFTNKAHAGFLGHAYVGRWVNLGAHTTNSDLKNTYGTVRLGAPGSPVETGLLKLGCLLGDHVKTAIGTLINTGTVVGAGAHLFGCSVPPKWVEPFSWGGTPNAPAVERERFLSVAATVFERRGIVCDEAARAWLGACWDAGRGTAE